MDEQTDPRLLVEALKSRNKEVSKLRKSLSDLVRCAEMCLKQLDAEMCKPSTAERGRNVARISNFLELEKDKAKHFGLGKKLDSSRQPDKKTVT